MKKRSEATEQEAVIQWAKWRAGEYPELSLLYHIPNGGSRNKAEAANLKRQGVRAGIPDLCLPVPSDGVHGLYIEMKYGKNKPTKEQKECMTKLNFFGYRAIVCYSADEAIAEIERYLHMENENDRFLI